MRNNKEYTGFAMHILNKPQYGKMLLYGHIKYQNITINIYNYLHKNNIY
jgi:hypothetical protein